ncbi:27258_t:CDS:1, partial [Racocetra persica]
MQRKGGKPPHQLSEYFYVIPNEWANKSNRKYICLACMEAVGRDFALQDESLKITNTLCYCANHLKDCSYFAAKHSSKQIQNIINLATSSTSNKHVAISQIKEDDDDSILTMSTHSFNLLLAFNENLSSSKRQTVLSQYIGHPLNTSEVSKFERLVLRAIISASIAFWWIENPEVKELFHFISPYLKLPNRRSLSNRILMNTTNKVQTTIKELVCKDKIGITIAFDGWRNVVNEELMGVVFITSSGETLIWSAENISIERQRKEEVISRIHDLFEKTKKLNIRANCLVTNSARSYAAAHRCLRREMRDKVFIPCFAHQANCC